MPSHRAGFSVGGVSVQLASTDLANVAFVASLEPFRTDHATSDIDIRVEWADDLCPPRGQKLFDSGSVWRLYEDGEGFQFDFSAPVLGLQPYKRLLVDGRFLRAKLQMSEECFAGTEYAGSPLEYPLDELLIMHRLTQEKAIELHSCGIVRPDGTGNLFVGHSGAGKSTTTRLWTAREDVEVLSDDRIIVRRDESASVIETPRASAGTARKYEVLRLRDRSASPAARFAQDDKPKKQIPRSARNDKRRMRMYGTPWHGEAAYASPGSAPLARIFILEHGHGNVLTRLSPSQAVAELFARSFVPFHRHEYVDSALEFLQELVGAVPCYHYAFEPNEAAVERILEFRD
ncbi:MAG: hypothetical protein WA741_07545 [Candidatus Sulfotelmatobacter sp.]